MQNAEVEDKNTLKAS